MNFLKLIFLALIAPFLLGSVEDDPLEEMKKGAHIVELDPGPTVFWENNEYDLDQFKKAFEKRTKSKEKVFISVNPETVAKNVVKLVDFFKAEEFDEIFVSTEAKQNQSSEP